MPTDLLALAQQRRLKQRKDAADLQAYVLLIPLIACFCSIALSVQFPTFACVITLLGAE